MEELTQEALEIKLMDDFFLNMLAQAVAFTHWVDGLPKLLIINPDIIGKLSRIKGFYERPELRALVPAHAPVVRYIRLVLPQEEVILKIIDDWDETFYHFEIE